MPVLVVLKKASSWRSSASKSADRILTFSLVMPMVNSPPRTPVKMAVPNATAISLAQVDWKAWGLGSMEA